jgi:hypothetical protein
MGALEKMDEVPGPRPEGYARQAAWPLKLTSFLSQILIIILVPDNHSFTHTTTLEHLRSPIVVEGDSLLSCTLMKLVKCEGSTPSLLALGNESIWSLGEGTKKNPARVFYAFYSRKCITGLPKT